MPSLFGTPTPRPASGMTFEFCPPLTKSLEGLLSLYVCFFIDLILFYFISNIKHAFFFFSYFISTLLVAGVPVTELSRLSIEGSNIIELKHALQDAVIQIKLLEAENAMLQQQKEEVSMI